MYHFVVKNKQPINNLTIYKLFNKVMRRVTNLFSENDKERDFTIIYLFPVFNRIHTAHERLGRNTNTGRWHPSDNIGNKSFIIFT